MIETIWKGDHFANYDTQQAMTSFRTSCRDAHFHLVANGTQPAERFTCRADEWPAIRGQIERLGLAWTVETFQNESVHYDVGKTQGLADHTARAIVTNNVREAGRLLGYPDCCVEAYIARYGRRALYEVVLQTPEVRIDKLGIHVQCFPECWPLAGLLAHELSFVHPCNLQCEGVRQYVRRTLSLIDKRLTCVYRSLIQPIRIEMLRNQTIMETEKLKVTFSGSSAEPLPEGLNFAILSVDILG